jgi:hypothetical protein
MTLLILPHDLHVPLTPFLHEAQSLALRELITYSTDPHRRAQLCTIDPHLRTLLLALETADDQSIAVLLYILANLTDPNIPTTASSVSLQPAHLQSLINILHTHRLTSDVALALSCSRLLMNLSLNSAACAHLLKERGIANTLVDALSSSLHSRPLRVEDLHIQHHLLRALLALIPLPSSKSTSSSLASSDSSSSFTVHIDQSYLESLCQRGLVKLLLAILTSSLPASLLTPTSLLDLTASTSSTSSTNNTKGTTEQELNTSQLGSAQALRTLHTTLKQLSFNILTHIAQVKSGMEALVQHEATLSTLLEMSDLGALFLDTQEVIDAHSLLPPQVAAVWPLLHQLLTNPTVAQRPLNTQHAATLARALTIVLSRTLHLTTTPSQSSTIDPTATPPPPPPPSEVYTVQLMTLTMLLSLAQHNTQMRDTIVLQNVLTPLQQMLNKNTTATTNSSFPSQHRLLCVQLLAWLALSKQGQQEIRDNGTLQLLVTLLSTLNTTLNSASLTNRDEWILRDQVLLALLHLSLSEQNRDTLAKLKPIPHILSPLLSLKTEALSNNTTSLSLQQSLIHILRLLCSLLYNRMLQFNEFHSLLFSLSLLSSPLLILIVFVRCADDIRNAVFDIEGVLSKLFELLSSTTSAELQIEVLSVLQTLCADIRCSRDFLNEGMMPLVSLLSNANQAIVISTLHILHHLLHFDQLREALRTYIDLPILEGLTNSPNPLIARLASQLKVILGS